MTYYVDLQRCTYFDSDVSDPPRTLAVGWLAPDWPYPRGALAADVLAKLFALVATAWQPMRFCGVHFCELCGSHAGSVGDDAGQAVPVGQSNRFVPLPDDSGFYAAPSLVLHYIREHAYLPPPAFCAAVLACPDTASPDYFRRIGPLLPPSGEWRDGWSLRFGEALAREAGLFCDREYDALRTRFGPGGSGWSAAARAAQPPDWFEQRYLAPLRAHIAACDRAAQTGEAAALRQWLAHVALLGCDAPADDAAD